MSPASNTAPCAPATRRTQLASLPRYGKSAPGCSTSTRTPSHCQDIPAWQACNPALDCPPAPARRRPATRHCRPAAGMVVVAMAEHHRVQPPHAEGAQRSAPPRASPASKPSASADPVSYKRAWVAVRTSTTGPAPRRPRPRRPRPVVAIPGPAIGRAATGTAPRPPPGRRAAAAARTPPAAPAARRTSAVPAARPSPAVRRRSMPARPQQVERPRRDLPHPLPILHAACPATGPASPSGSPPGSTRGPPRQARQRPANEACPNSTTVSGNRPMVATTCAPTGHAPALQPRGPWSAGRHHSNHATPAKLSQKPAPSTASGSSSRTRMQPSASVSTSRAGDAATSGRRPAPRSSPPYAVSAMRSR